MDMKPGAGCLLVLLLLPAILWEEFKKMFKKDGK